MEWLPIETAPKDGTQILTHHLFGGRSIFRTAIWKFGTWVIGGTQQRVEPTHWQPLPEPPPPHNTKG